MPIQEGNEQYDFDQLYSAMLAIQSVHEAQIIALTGFMQAMCKVMLPDEKERYEYLMNYYDAILKNELYKVKHNNIVHQLLKQQEARDELGGLGIDFSRTV